ncbi:MAG: bifunctional 4-hydroxy-2-oxoglutarate aldolase/2-dehydro-3-deoxy-phosphogluconate aldolase [Dehalococcoidia bacterium]|nr:bifunctional 4-hydroxy-2-oxoglutarate aldolase/2-dehydro-3-deoxy-phosphogluconate aldolase [Dehalococcoidia bacterium]
MDRAYILEAMLDARLVAVVRAGTLAQARRAAQAVMEAGFRLVEITFTVPDAPALIEELAHTAPDGVLVGAGSVTNGDHARLAIGAGARYVVSPIRQLDLVRVCHQVGVPCILGALTATEIVDAHRAGADLVKVFPVGLVGGPRYIRQILGPLPGLSLMASGGVNLSNFQDFLEAGARCLALGSDLLNPTLVKEGDHAAMVRRAREYLRALEKS